MAIPRRNIIWVVAALGVVVLLLMSFRPKPVEVDTATVGRARLSVSVEGDARVRVRNRYVITAPVSGQLLRIALQAGDKVAPGAELARIAPAPQDPQTAAMARARLDATLAVREEAGVRVQQAANEAENARRTYDRLVPLHQSGAISNQELENAELAARRAKDELAAATRRREAAEADVSASRAAIAAVDAVIAGERIVSVRSPSRGLLLRLAPEGRSERVVASGMLLMEIGNPEDMEVVIDVLSTDAVRIATGNRVDLTGWGGDSTLIANVELVEPSATTRVSALGVEEQRVNVIARFTTTPYNLGDGFHAGARIVIWEQDNLLSAPVSALFRLGEGWNTYVVRDGKAALQKIEVGHISDTAAEILSGLSEGDEVVLFPSDKIQGGVLVKRR